MGAYLTKKEKFFVILCGDVLLEVLQFGKRRQLAKLERVGRRLHWMVENFYGSRPFLRLCFTLCTSGRMEPFIIGNRETEVSLANLTSVSIPRYLRFNEVNLFCGCTIVDQKSIKEKCRSIENYLQPLKEALKDSNFVRFDGDIDRNDHKKFSDHSKLLEYLSDQLLKICNSSRGYNFSIYFHAEEAGAEVNVINSIIQMPQICRCSNLRFELWFVRQPMLLPVEAISSWLNRTIGDGMNFNGRAPQEIFLRIFTISIQNAVEMCDHLVETFNEANTPTLAYTFQMCLHFDNNSGLTNVEEQMLLNRKTNEEFSIHKDGPHKIVIKRMAAKKWKN